MNITAIIITCAGFASFITVIKLLLDSNGEIDFDFDLKSGKGKFIRKSKN